MSQEEHLKQFASKLWLTDYLHGYRTPEDLWTFGIEDSLAVLNHVELRGRVLDIGPGGGLPGIVLAIVLRDVQFTLVDSSQKSCKFLTEITSALGLTNVQVLHERIEDFGKVHREEYDFAISRAVAEIRILAEYVAAPLKVGGMAVLWKGPSWVEELRTAQNALAKLRLAFKENHDYFLDDRFRTLVVLSKEAPTPHGFPRKAGIPEKKAFVGGVCLMFYLSLLKAAALGVVEGVTEFLPVSSTGHLIIVNQWIRFPEPFNASFDVIVQMGAILAVVILFWNEYNVFNSKEKQHVLINYRNIIVAIIPAIIVGATFGDVIQTYLFSVLTVSIALILGALFLWYAERNSSGTVHKVGNINALTALKIGLFQLLSYFPGFSRSAASIGGGMLSGLTREAAAQFSFLLGAPTLLAAGGYELLKSGFTFTMQEWAVLLVGCFFSFLSAYLVVKPFLQFVSKRSYKPFIIYRVVLGALLLVMYFL